MRFIFVFLLFLKPIFASDRPFLPDAHLYLNGDHGYYTLHTEYLPEVERELVDQVSTAAEMFRAVIPFSRRPDSQTPLSYQQIKTAYYDARRDGRVQHGEIPDLSANMPVTIAQGEEMTETQMIDVVKSFFNERGLSDVSEKFETRIVSARLKHEENFIKYHEALTIFGEWRLGTLRNFINKGLLGITNQPQILGGEELFQMMKRVGFISADIETTYGYRYSQTIAAEEFLRDHPEVHTLVLACGNFIPYVVSQPFAGRSEGGCACCHDLHHISKGEMTVTLPDQLTYLREDYNEEGSASDIIGDISSEPFWAGIIRGLGDRKLTSIKDHNGSNPLLIFEHIEAVKSVLSPEGFLEVVVPDSREGEFLAKLIECGFFVTAQDKQRSRIQAQMRLSL